MNQKTSIRPKALRVCLVIFLFSLLSFNSKAQSCYDKLKSQPIKFDLSKPVEKETQQPFLNDLYCLLEVGLDSIDIDILFHDSYLSNIYIDLINEVQDGERKITYRNLLAVYMRIKSRYDYDFNILRFKLARELRETPAVFSNWDKVQNTLLTTELDWFEEDFIALFENYLFEHADSSLNMLDLLDDFDRQQMELSELFDKVFFPNKLDIDAYLEESITENKPILLYFTPISSEAGEKIEQNVLKNQEILDELESRFIFKSHFIDDIRKLEENEWVHYEKLNKTAKTIGEVNSFYQMENFKMATTPSFVAINKKNVVLFVAGYEDFSNPKDFLDFLNNVNSAFHKDE